MENKEVIIDITRYNLWANHTLAEVLQKQSNELLNREMKSSFRSIRKTIHHIFDAESIWLDRLKGISALDWPSKNLTDNSPIELFLKISNDFVSFLEQQPESYFTRETSYLNLKKEKFSTVNYGIILHCMNHSTFHRGQVITLLRNADVTELPSTDMITYIRNKK